MVGVLYIQDLLTIGQKAKSHRVSTVMDKNVYYIRENRSLQHALAAFLKVKRHLFVVVNEFRGAGILAKNIWAGAQSSDPIAAVRSFIRHDPDAVARQLMRIYFA